MKRKEGEDECAEEIHTAINMPECPRTVMQVSSY